MTPGNGAIRPRGAPAPGEVHVWRADLDDPGWPRAGLLPAEERRRAAAIGPALRRRRWAASRWALRQALSRYLGVEPGALELRSAAAGKPWLADAPDLRFNLSHSAAVALIAISVGREVGIDVERRRHRPAAFYEEWTRREAIGKCFGVGLAKPPTHPPARVVALAAGDGWAAALAIAGTREPRVRRWDLTPAATAALGRR